MGIFNGKKRLKGDKIEITVYGTYNIIFTVIKIFISYHYMLPWRKLNYLKIPLWKPLPWIREMLKIFSMVWKSFYTIII